MPAFTLVDDLTVIVSPGIQDPWTGKRGFLVLVVVRVEVAVKASRPEAARASVVWTKGEVEVVYASVDVPTVYETFPIEVPVD